MKKVLNLALFILIIFSINSFAEDIKGNLVIVGGGLANNNEDIYNKFINLAGGKDAKIGIIPTASDKLKSTKNFKDDLVDFGMNANNILVIEITKHDFKKTNENEAITWKGNENSSKIVKQIKNLDGIWFVGGDQRRITNAFYNEDGSKTKALEAIWDIYKNGAVLGGTSAGAAIMSEKMIYDGDSIGALKKGIMKSDKISGEFESSGVLLKDGLGFFPHGIIDQHYDKRARLARTIIADIFIGKSNQMAFGVDENTALIYRAENNLIEVAGEGHITVIDSSNSNLISGSPRTKIDNIKISLITKGDTLNPLTKEIIIDENKLLTNGYEYIGNKLPLATGALSSYGQLKDYLAYGLVDNGEAKIATTYSFDEDGLGFQFDFKKFEDTKGYYGTRNRRDNYSMENIYLKITPIMVEVKTR